MDGSAAYLGTINLGLLSVYYYLLEKLGEAGFDYQVDTRGRPLNVRIAWVDSEMQVVPSSKYVSGEKTIPLPIVFIEDTGGNLVPFELGNPLSAKGRSYTITVFAESVVERNRYVDFLENAFSEREITIYDYNSGLPATVADNSSMPIFGYSTTSTVFCRQHDDPFDPNVMDRHIGMISFMLEILPRIE